MPLSQPDSSNVVFNLWGSGILIKISWIFPLLPYANTDFVLWLYLYLKNKPSKEKNVVKVSREIIPMPPADWAKRCFQGINNQMWKGQLTGREGWLIPVSRRRKALNYRGPKDESLSSDDLSEAIWHSWCLKVTAVCLRKLKLLARSWYF